MVIAMIHPGSKQNEFHALALRQVPVIPLILTNASRRNHNERHQSQTKKIKGINFPQCIIARSTINDKI